MNNQRDYLSQYNESHFGSKYIKELFLLANRMLYTENFTKLGDVKPLSQFPYNNQVGTTKHG